MSAIIIRQSSYQNGSGIWISRRSEGGLMDSNRLTRHIGPHIQNQTAITVLGRLHSRYSGSAQFVLRSLFFSAAGLSAGDHNVQWVLHTTKTNGSTRLFDYGGGDSGDHFSAVLAASSPRLPSLPSAPSAPSAPSGMAGTRTDGTRSTTDVSSLPPDVAFSVSAPTDPFVLAIASAGRRRYEHARARVGNRLAQLEAHVVQLDLGVPPPYVPPTEGT
ncbi:hypothetical protein B0H13DRAFT_1904748 [Mycena leptocephala]|nr:hypothetical protein B0H13DRAFT_1904748 [Mycena leptocephala]